MIIDRIWMLGGFVRLDSHEVRAVQKHLAVARATLRLGGRAIDGMRRLECQPSNVFGVVSCSQRPIVSMESS